MGKFVIFEDVYDNIFKNHDSAQLLFGEKDCMSIKEGEEEVYFDIILHTILNPIESLSSWAQNLKQSTNLIIPFLPYTEFDLIVSGFYEINKIKPFITIIAALNQKSIKYKEQNENEKIIEGGLTFYEIEVAKFENVEVGKEIRTSKEYNKYHVVNKKDFCENFFTEPKKAEEYLTSLKEKVDRDYYN